MQGVRQEIHKETVREERTGGEERKEAGKEKNKQVYMMGLEEQ